MNRLSGRIAGLEVSGSVSLVDVQVGNHVYTSTILGSVDVLTAWKVGTPVTLLFKETEVALAKNLSGAVSLRNRFKGIVTALENGQVLSKVIFDVDGQAISSIITTRSSTAMHIAIGDEIEGLVKANEMTIVLDSDV